MADSGKTLEAVLAKIRGRTGRQVVAATLLAKRESIVMPDVYAAGIVDSRVWFVFEYEVRETRRHFEETDNMKGLQFLKESFTE